MAKTVILINVQQAFVEDSYKFRIENIWTKYSSFSGQYPNKASPKLILLDDEQQYFKTYPDLTTIVQQELEVIIITTPER